METEKARKWSTDTDRRVGLPGMYEVNGATTACPLSLVRETFEKIFSSRARVKRVVKTCKREREKKKEEKATGSERFDSEGTFRTVKSRKRREKTSVSIVDAFKDLL